MTFQDFQAECDKLALEGVQAAVVDVGSKAALARLVQRSREAIINWKAVPLVHVKTICNETGRPPNRYRPDVFAAPRLLRELAK